MKSLNALYNENKITYLCNSCGDVFVRDDDAADGENSTYIGNISVDKDKVHEAVSVKEENLLDRYWTDGLDCLMYVGIVEGRLGMILGALFDYPYLAEKAQIPFEREEDAQKAVRANRAHITATLQDVIAMLESHNKFPRCEFLYGEDTDPCGDEILLFVPYEQREFIQQYAEKYAGKLYELFESLL